MPWLISVNADNPVVSVYLVTNGFLILFLVESRYFTNPQQCRDAFSKSRTEAAPKTRSNMTGNTLDLYLSRLPSRNGPITGTLLAVRSSPFVTSIYQGIIVFSQHHQEAREYLFLSMTYSRLHSQLASGEESSWGGELIICPPFIFTYCNYRDSMIFL